MRIPQNASRLPGRHFLQIPGPTPVPDRILRAIDMPLIDHRGPEFAELGKRVLEGMKTIFKTTNPVIIYTASGTGAWEAALVNTLSPGDRVLMVETGQFATLWKEDGRAARAEAGVHPDRLAHRRRSEASRRVCAEDKAHEIKAVCVVHNETSTGLAPIDEIRKAMDAAGHPALLMVDTISSLALDRLPPRRMGRRCRHRRLAEGADAAARHVVQRRERKGASPPARPRSCRDLLVAGTTC